jgi:hypothetical protein
MNDRTNSVKEWNTNRPEPKSKVALRDGVCLGACRNGSSMTIQSSGLLMTHERLPVPICHDRFLGRPAALSIQDVETGAHREALSQCATATVGVLTSAS